MEINSKILEYIVDVCQKKMDSYVRPKKEFDKNIVESLVQEFYSLENKKITKIEWLISDDLVENKISSLKKPWVYHYESNITWILYYKYFYEECLKMSDNGCKYFVKESKKFYKKVLLLKNILENIDGITELDEDSGVVYLVKNDFSFIKKIPKVFTLN